MKTTGGGRARAGADTAVGSQEFGASYAELLIVLAIAAAVAGMAVPVTAHVIDSARARDAAGFVAARFRAARSEAVLETRSIGVVFDQAGTRWTLRVCRDGNGNGIRRADLASGLDACSDGPYDLGQLFPGVTIAVDPSLPDPDNQTGSADAVRFGKSDIASFSDTGTCTAGTLFLRSPAGQEYAVRVSNVTGRTRILRFDPGGRKWNAE